MLGRNPISSAPISSAARAPVSFLWRNQVVDLELVTRIYREDGTFVEIVNERRGLVKSTKRKHQVLELEVVDVDRSALEGLLPSKRYTTADFPKLFTDHVGKAVAQVVGDALKVPLAYIDNTVGAYRYLACEVIGTAPTVRTVYRAGRVVSASEYSVDTTTVAGTTYLRITFTREQVDFNGSIYPLEADLLGPGSRAASDEIKRNLQLLGATVDSSSFDVASLYCITNRMLVDCPYVEPRQGIAILQDLLQVARGQLYKTPAGAYGIFIDKPRDVHIALDDGTDELQVDDYGEPDIIKTLTLEYRPSTSQQEKYTGKLSRTTIGAVGERVMKNPFIRDHEVADRLLCYLQKRENVRAESHVSIHAVQLAPGELVAIRSELTWGGGWKTFSAPQVTRPADRNSLTLREYVETIFAYTPGPLPADATNGYQPDYSQTPPAAPTGLTVVSQGTSSDTDGKTVAYALIRAVPPLVNWQKLMVQVTDTTTNEVYQAQLLLNGSNYEATISGLRPNRAHQVVAWAVNANNVDGTATAPASFTSANATGGPTYPGSIGVIQTQSFDLQIDWGAVTDVAGSPKIRRYVLFEKIGGGAYTEIARPDTTRYTRPGISHGTLYTYKVRTEDINGIESADSGLTASITPAAKIDNSYIIPLGVGNASLANTSVNAAKVDWAYTVNNYAFTGAGGSVGIGILGVGFVPWVEATGGGNTVGITIVGTPSGTAMGARNDTGGAFNLTVKDPAFV